ncbi:acyl-CoA dehydrogenase family protein [Alicyclobacillus cycloheptanicus]|uniref:Alkylation response protein AidB-like acyl-CoA dehydrogenase n=1 Tax=Alicyclobacillus cycloheptanicus TaxID=1457 RepID=A0ABT9XGC1_9BACL|nr:acyl-CoA dehydrogenase family protein [Alicyclobacillus cycloheptanicus]MDQ0189339.1 alkylation response protein AidB-like acyl-CoA dehydrogenase [Alicyclobacillus cycloheptanicus]
MTEEHTKGSEYALDQPGSNPYSFDTFLEQRDGFDYYNDDEFLRDLVAHYAGDEAARIHETASVLSHKVRTRWRALSEQAARPEYHPRLLHYDAYNHRIDRVVRSLETETLEREIFAEALFSNRVTPWEMFVKRFVINQLGEFGVVCPMTCTEGLIGILELLGDPSHSELARILRHCKEGIDGEFGVGAQFMTEIQGGSDLPANRVEAVADGAAYRIYGKKFFTSVAHADYAVLTARVKGTDHIGVFVVPSWLPGDKARERRNGFEIQRLKWKMGTTELPTGEIEYKGALAYPVGPLHRGLANAVGIVLTLSRLSIGIASAAMMTRAAREARMYAEFRTVFGRRIVDYPLSARELNWLDDMAKRTTAGAFAVFDLYLRCGGRQALAARTDMSLAERKRQWQLRELILLQKVCAAGQTVDVVRKAMSIFGGHGVMEDFSALPRLLRDAAVNELWEGPKNLLLTQVYRDLQRAASWYDTKEFIADVLAGADASLTADLGERFAQLLAEPVLGDVDEGSITAAAAWEQCCTELFAAYQQLALQSVTAVRVSP